MLQRHFRDAGVWDGAPRPARVYHGVLVPIMACLLIVPPLLAQTAPIAIDYPAEGSLFPPEIIPPTFVWRDAAPTATRWRISVVFADRSPGIDVQSPGERMPIGEIDERCAKAGAVPPTLTPREAEAHSWKPDDRIWTAIKQRSVKHAATVIIAGFAGEDAAQAVSRGQVAIRTSADPVGAPLFYRDVPLVPFPEGQKGVIMPLPREAIPLIAWRLLNIGEARSKVKWRK